MIQAHPSDLNFNSMLNKPYSPCSYRSKFSWRTSRFMTLHKQMLCLFHAGPHPATRALILTMSHQRLIFWNWTSGRRMEKTRPEIPLLCNIVNESLFSQVTTKPSVVISCHKLGEFLGNNINEKVHFVDGTDWTSRFNLKVPRITQPENTCFEYNPTAVLGRSVWNMASHRFKTDHQPKV